jgi:hypothetical protein
LAVECGLLSSLEIVMGKPKEREKPTGFTMAWTPVRTALIANITLTAMKVERRRLMVDRYGNIPGMRRIGVLSAYEINAHKV